ncbi:MAG: hypothetical protein HYT47_00360 [Candidatus Vogelbacteria bacterium]|nr:hypothetical protein [Candidatus Vogelbacteria bacterium]
MDNDNLALRINEYMTANKVPSLAAFGRLLATVPGGSSVDRSTVRSWVAEGRRPRKKTHLKALKELLDARPAKVAQGLSELRLEVAAAKIIDLNFVLRWLLLDASQENRWWVRDRLGQEFQDFVDLARAFTNEKMRDKVLEEDGLRLQKGGSNARNNRNSN